MNQQIKEILEHAINFEKESYTFYTGLKEIIKNRALHGVLDELAQAEIGHQTRLEQMLKDLDEKESEMFISMEPKQVENMQLSEFLVPIKLNPESSFQDILISAMHREGRAYDFYQKMETLASSEETHKLFEVLAKEELEHKNIIEKWYDDEVYKEF